jgi:hypothetical protein
VDLYPYSIYLWQRVFGLDSRIQAVFPIQLAGFPFFAWHFFGCVVFGIVMARLMEFPVLSMREKLLPPEQTTVAPPPPGTPFEALSSAKNAQARNTYSKSSSAPRSRVRLRVRTAAPWEGRGVVVAR